MQLFAPIVNFFALRIYRSRFIAKLLFRIKFLPVGYQDYYFDITTIILNRYAAKQIGPNDHIVDMGCGAHATIGISLWKKTGCTVLCCDVNPELVELARKNIIHNAAPISASVSNLFASVPADFNIVIFNPPYMPSAFGNEKITRRSQWDGGLDGASIVGSLLDAMQTIDRPLQLFLGVNSMFIPAEKIAAMLDERESLQLERTVGAPLLPVDIHVISRDA